MAAFFRSASSPEPADTSPPNETGLPFPATAATRFGDWIAAGVITGILFLIYMLTSSRWAFPGESARLITLLTGARPNLMPDHGLWQSIMGALVRMAGPAHAVTTATVANMAVAALSLGMTYLVTTAVFVLLIDKRDLDPDADLWTFHAGFAARLGAMVTTLALAFSAPFWVAASRVNLYALYLLWILICAHLLLRFLGEGRVVFLFIGCLLYGMGMSQSTVMIQFAPVFAILAVIGLARVDRLNGLTGGLALLLLCAGFAALFLFSINAYVDTPGYALQGYWGKSLVAEKLLQNLGRGLLGSLPRNGWLILVGLVILPWIAWLIVARRTLNGESGPAVQFLNLAIFVVTLTVVLDSRVSPWQFFGFSAEQIVSYTMTSMTFGYCITTAYMYTVNLLSVQSDSKLAMLAGRALRGVVIAFAAMVLVHAVRASAVHAETRNTQFILTYVDRLIDNLDGRTWIVTDGVFDDLILLRGIERGQTLHLLDLRSAGSAVYLRQLREHIPAARLRNALDLGVFAFLQEWIASDPTVTRQLALCLFPDLWTIGDYRIYPRGLAFLGATAKEAAHIDSLAGADQVHAFFTLMDELGAELDVVSDRASPYIQALAQAVRRRVSFVGNNLGYFIETLGRSEDALPVYARVHAFDPDNVSAMLNYAFLLERFGKETEKQIVFDRIERFKHAQTKPLHIWELSRTQGYVNSPEAFAYLGWTWALSGHNAIAIKTLGLALNADADSLGVLGMLANVHSRQGDVTETESVLNAILEKAPDDIKTLVALAQIKMLNGETDEAERLLDRAVELGLPPARARREIASLKLAAGDYDGARDALRELLEETPRDADARLSLYMTHAKAFISEADPARQAEIRSNMQAEIDALFRIPDARFFQGAIARGHLNLVENKFAAAREDFLMANKTMPGILPILELLLRLDYALKDPASARTHATAILQISPNHAFANYIMGSIALTRREFESAEAYLERSVEQDANLLATGDLAYVKFRLDNLEVAFKLVTQALDRSKELYEIWDTYGLILLEQGKPEEAEAAFRTALRLNVQNPIVHLHLARALFTQGRKSDSRNILEEIEPFQASLYGEEKHYYEQLWRDVFGLEGIREAIR